MKSLSSLLLAVFLTATAEGGALSWTPHPDNRGLWLEYWCYDANDRMDFHAVDEIPITPEMSHGTMHRLPLPIEHPDGVGCGVTLMVLRGEHPFEPHKWYVAESVTSAWRN